MNINFDHQIFSIQRYGGISRYIVELANELSSRGKNVKVNSVLYVNALLYQAYLANDKISSKNYFESIPKVLAWSVNEIVTQIYKVNSKCDVFHETYYSPLDRAPKFSKKVLTVHDLIYFKFPELFKNKDLSRAVIARAIRRADSLICVSESTKSDLLELFHVSENKVHVIYHGKSFSRLDTYLPTDLPFPYLLFVGNRGFYKNFECLLKAYAQSSKLNMNLKLVCFGGGPLSHRESCKLEELGLKPNHLIMLSGDDQLLASLYRGATAYIYPSLYEGFGMPILEAMELGAPVICSNIAAFREVAADAAQYFNPQSYNDLREKIEYVVFNNDVNLLLRRLGSGRAQSFSWGECANQTLRVYESE